MHGNGHVSVIRAVCAHSHGNTVHSLYLTRTHIHIYIYIHNSTNRQNVEGGGGAGGNVPLFPSLVWSQQNNLQESCRRVCKHGRQLTSRHTPTHTYAGRQAHAHTPTHTYMHLHKYIKIQGLEKIIGKLVKFKESLFNMELVFLQPSVQLQFI